MLNKFLGSFGDRIDSLPFVVSSAVTVVVLGVTGFLVFGCWYIYPYDEMMEVAKLYGLVAMCAFILGPFLVLIVTRPKKEKSALIFDCVVITSVQLLSFVYGLQLLTEMRPIYLVFAVDRYVVVSAGEIPSGPREMVSVTLRESSSWKPSPQVVFAELPTDPDENLSLILTALSGGKDIQHVVENYRDIQDHVDEIILKAKPLEDLEAKLVGRNLELQGIVGNSGVSVDRVRWLPVQFKQKFWTVLVHADTALPVAWLDFDPYS